MGAGYADLFLADKRFTIIHAAQHVQLQLHRPLRRVQVKQIFIGTAIHCARYGYCRRSIDADPRIPAFFPHDTGSMKVGIRAPLKRDRQLSAVRQNPAGTGIRAAVNDELHLSSAGGQV